MRLIRLSNRRARDPRARRFPVAARPLLTGLAVLGLLHAPAVSAAVPPTLTREVTLQGTGRSGWISVTVPRDLQFPAGGQPQIVKVSNAAAFAGVALVRQQRGPMPPGAAVLPLPAGAGRPYGYAFFGHDRGTLEDDDDPVFFTRKLRAGTYRLYLLSRGSAKVSVTVRFPVRSGRRAFTMPRNGAVHDVATLAPGVPGTAVSSYHTLSGTAELGRRGLLLDIMWWDGDLAANFDTGSCFYSGSLPDPGPVPTCPNGPGALAGGQGPEQPTSRFGVGYMYAEPGQWLHKAFYEVVGPLKYGGIALYWLDLGAGFPTN